MLLSSNLSDDGKTQTITAAGHLGVDQAVEFKNIYRSAPDTVSTYTIDLGNVSYLNDADLGYKIGTLQHSGNNKSITG